MDLIQHNEIILLLWDHLFEAEKSKINVEELKTNYDASIKFENIQRFSVDSYEHASFTLIILKANENLDIPLFASLLKLLKRNGRIVVTTQNTLQIGESLKLAGFVNIQSKQNDTVVAEKKYEIGSSAKLSFSGKDKQVTKTPNVWKLSDEDDELINENDLIDDCDKEKPNPSNLRVCGTTGKRKACKDCSCGLAEELANDGKPKDQLMENAKSSCGSCYLGDAFRCATCPYLGMPAFKPGEKVQLSGGLLKDDL